MSRKNGLFTVHELNQCMPQLKKVLLFGLDDIQILPPIEVKLD